MNKLFKELKYNAAQIIFILCLQRIRILEWGRGTGKSTILGRYIYDCVIQMPRSSGALVAETYRQIQSRTLPSTIAGLEQHGLIKGLHFFVSKKPPASFGWPEPYEPPLDYKYGIIFWNGTFMHFISQDHSSSSGRGMNIDWALGDEAARLDEKKFETDVLLTNRGNMYRYAVYPDGTKRYFKDCPLHHSIVLASSTPVTVNGRWFLKFEEQAILNPDKVAFIRASAEVNRENLGDDYFTDAKQIMADFLYKAEVENIRLKSIDNGFYPLLDEDIHCYNQYKYSSDIDESYISTCDGDADHNANRPLILGMDWGANINCLVVCQNDELEFKVLKNLYVKHPKIIDDLVDDFCSYYKTHQDKTIYLYYDPSGNVRVANSKRTYAEQAKARFNKKGWNVQLMTGANRNILHHTKYNLWNDILRNEEKKYPSFRVNRSNCRELWISMTNAPAKAGFKEAITKDKGSERSKSLDQAHATHFSDAIDLIMVGLFIDRMHATVRHIPTSIR